MCKTLSKQHKTFLDNISGSPQHEREKKKKKSELGIKMAEKKDYSHFKHRLKKVSFRYV